MTEKFRKALRYGLSGAELLSDPAAVQRDCNGIGPEWMPAWLRWVISAICPSVLLAADIHDIRYGVGGTDHDRARADAEFLVNVELIALGHGFLRRFIVRRLGVKMYSLLRRWGGLAWKYTIKQE